MSLSYRNLPLMYIIKFCRGLLFSVSVLYLFYNHYNLGTTELYIVQSIFSIWVVVLEIPTGFISDKYSRKLSLVIWLLLSAIGLGIYSQTNNLRWFAFSELILTIGYCCMSWTDTALIYDTIAHDNNSKQYKKISGRYHGLSSLSEAIGGIVGWYIIVYGINFPLILDSIFAGVAFMTALFLVEPPRKKFDPLEWSRIQVSQTLSFVYHHKKIWRLILFSAFTSTITINMVRFSQPYMKLVDLPIVRVGRFWCVMNASGSIVSLFIHKIEQYLTQRLFMIAIIVWWVICMMILAFFPSLWLLPIFLLFQFTRQWNRLISNDNLHVLTESSIRSTVQSINSMAFRLCFALWWPVFGYIYAHSGLVFALWASSLVLGGWAIFAWWKFNYDSE